MNVEETFNLGSALQREGRFQEAAICFAKAIRERPESAAAHNNLAVSLLRLGRPTEAIVVLSTAAELAPQSHEVRNNLGNVLQQIGRIDEAIAQYREALRLMPHYADALNNLGNALKESGNIEAAIETYEQAVSSPPGHRVAASARLYAMHFHPAYDAQRLLPEHRQWNDCYAREVAPIAERFENDPSPSRKLRVGYVSAEWREHPVGRFMWPLLANHDREQVEVYCYSDVTRPDAMTAKLQACAHAWRETAAISDEALAQQICADRIDVLIDLTMHMAHSRLLAFARRPAPVQVTHLAYCSTTGLEAMQYRLTDSWLDPAGTDGDYVERSLRLNSYWCYAPPEDAPEIAGRGDLREVTFGCLNNFCKISAPAWEAWGTILCAVPESRLIVHSHEGAHRERAREMIAAQGADASRVEFTGFLPMPAYLQQYSRIDLGLDPFPWCGGTTTCDALWMGVPVVTLRGPTAVGRGGASILSQVGLADLIAETPAEYVKIAVALARDAQRRLELRPTMRRKMRASSLMDAASHARDVENAYRTMWRNWCEDSRR